MKTFIRIGIFLALCFGMLAIVIIGAFQEHNEDIKEWNEGICIYCGEGEYRLLNIEHIKTIGDKYHFVCENCNASIELNYNPNNK